MTWQNDPFGRTRAPRGLTREGRVALLLEAFEALLAGQLPELEARLFLAGGGLAWLSEGRRVGSLERDFWRVSPEAGCTVTPRDIASAIRSSRGATEAEETETIAPVATSDDASDG